MALADSKTMKAMVEFREHTGKREFKIEPCLLIIIKLDTIYLMSVILSILKTWGIDHCLCCYIY